MTQSEISERITSILNITAAHSARITNLQDDVKDLKPLATEVSLLINEIKWHAKLFWTVAGLYAIIFTGLVTWYLPKELNQINNKSSDDISSLQGQLLILRAPQSPLPVLSELSRSNLVTFEKSLPALREVSERPVSEVNPSADILRQITHKLIQTDEDTPDYWPAILQFIQFSSAAVAPASIPPPGPPQTILSRIYSPSPNGLIFAPIKNQRVLLDGGEIWNLTFQNCRIIFTQNPVRMHNFRFIDCVFEMPITDAPSPYLKRASHLLIASDLASVTIPSL